MLNKRQEVLFEVEYRNGVKREETLIINLKDQEHQSIQLYRDWGYSATKLEIKNIDIHKENEEIIFQLKGSRSEKRRDEDKVIINIRFKDNDITAEEYQELKEKIFEITGADTMVDYILNLEYKKQPKKELELVNSIVNLDFTKISEKSYEEFLNNLSQEDVELLGNTKEHLEYGWETCFSLPKETINRIEELFSKSDLEVGVRVNKVFK